MSGLTPRSFRWWCLTSRRRCVPQRGSWHWWCGWSSLTMWRKMCRAGSPRHNNGRACHRSRGAPPSCLTRWWHLPGRRSARRRWWCWSPTLRGCGRGWQAHCRCQARRWRSRGRRFRQPCRRWRMRNRGNGRRWMSRCCMSRGIRRQPWRWLSPVLTGRQSRWSHLRNMSFRRGRWWSGRCW